jgi:hypothetical protein
MCGLFLPLPPHLGTHYCPTAGMLLVTLTMHHVVLDLAELEYGPTAYNLDRW